MIDPGTMAAVVVAAGESRRFGGDKLFARLGGRAVLFWSLAALERSPRVSRVVLVLSDTNLKRGRRLVARYGLQKVQAVCRGGSRRQDSVWSGLQEVAGWEWVAVHDGARPFLTPDLLERGFDVARTIGAAVAAVPVKDTVKVVDGAKLIQSTPRRANLWAAQTPQIFRYEQIVDAYRRCGSEDATDDAELLERSGQPCAVFLGSYENLKITTTEDLTMARLIARQRRCP